jgi:26S proteasome regulatory subunit T6
LTGGASGCRGQGICTEAGMYALREREFMSSRRNFEVAVSKVLQEDSESNMSIKLFK